MKVKSDESIPYEQLTPDCILDALESVGLRPDGRMLALNSYENRVYQLGIEDAQPVVAKFYRPERWNQAQILEEHAFVQSLVEAEITAVPALELGNPPTTLHRHQGYWFAVYPRRGGRAPELDNFDTLTWLGRFIGRIHAVGSVSDFRHRPTLDIESFAIEPREFLRRGEWLPRDLKKPYEEASQEAVDLVQAAFATNTPRSIRLHGDCHPGNVLWTDSGEQPGPHFVDFDDARMGPAVQDLWMLLAGDRQQQTLQMSAILEGYEDFAAFDRRELRLIEPLRTLRLIHYAAWLARRWHDPAFPMNFPWFGSHRYWLERIAELREQSLLMREPPLMV